MSIKGGSPASASDQGNTDTKLSSKIFSHLHESRASAFRDVTTTTNTNTNDNNNDNNDNSESLVCDGRYPAPLARGLAASPRLRSTLSLDAAQGVDCDDDYEVRRLGNSGNTNSRGQEAAQQHEQAGDSSLTSSSGIAVRGLSRYPTTPPRQTTISPWSNLHRSGEISAKQNSSENHRFGSSKSPAVDLVGAVLTGLHESPMSSISSRGFSRTSSAPEGQFNNWLRTTMKLRSTIRKKGGMGEGLMVSKATMELAKARRKREALEESDSEATSSLSSENENDCHGDRVVATNRLARTLTVSPPRSTIAPNPRVSVATPAVAGEVLFPTGRQTTIKTPDRDVGRRLTRIRGVVVRKTWETSIGWDMMARHVGGIEPEPGNNLPKVSVEIAKARREREAKEESDSASDSSSSKAENDSDGHGGGGVAKNGFATKPTVSPPRPTIAVSSRLTIKALEPTGESLLPISRQAVTKTPETDVGRRHTKNRDVIGGDNDCEKEKCSTGLDPRVRHDGGIAPEPARSIRKISPIVGEPSYSASAGTTKTMTPRGGKCGGEDSDQDAIASKTEPREGKITTPGTLSERCVRESLHHRTVASSGFHANVLRPLSRDNALRKALGDTVPALETSTSTSSGSTLEKPDVSADGTGLGREKNAGRRPEAAQRPPGDRPQPEGKLEQQSGVQTHFPRPQTRAKGAENEETGGQEELRSNNQTTVSPAHSGDVDSDERAQVSSSNAEGAEANEKSPSQARSPMAPVDISPQRGSNPVNTMGQEISRSTRVNAQAGSTLFPDLYLSPALQQNIVFFPVSLNAISPPTTLPVLAGDRGSHSDGNEDSPMGVLDMARCSARHDGGSGKSWASEPEAQRARIVAEATATLANVGSVRKSPSISSTELKCRGGGVRCNEKLKNDRRAMMPSSWRPALIIAKERAPLVRDPWCVRILVEAAATLASSVKRSIAIPSARTNAGVLSSGEDNGRDDVVKRKCQESSGDGSVYSSKSRKQCHFSVTAQSRNSKSGVTTLHRWTFCGSRPSLQLPVIVDFGSCGLGGSSPRRPVRSGRTNSPGEDSPGWRRSFQLPLITDFGSCGPGGSAPHRLVSRGRTRDHGKASPGSRHRPIGWSPPRKEVPAVGSEEGKHE